MGLYFSFIKPLESVPEYYQVSCEVAADVERDPNVFLLLSPLITTPNAAQIGYNITIISRGPFY